MQLGYSYLNQNPIRRTATVRMQDAVWALITNPSTNAKLWMVGFPVGALLAAVAMFNI